MTTGGVSLPLARVVVLVSGAAILVVETLATRLVAPYVGLTLESTTAVIGVALAGIAAGAALGGRLADRTAPRRVVGLALVLGGLGVLAARPLVRALGPMVSAGAEGAVVLVAMSTLVPVVALAAVTPAVTRARLDGAGDGTGRVVGSLSAVGTLGSLAGTFLTGFVLVALLPVSAILIGTGATCLVLALVVTRTATRREVAATGGAALVLAVLLVAVPGRCDVDTTYYCARVEAGERPSERVLVLDDLVHSRVDLADPTHLESAYTRRIADAIDASHPAGAPLAAVHVGGGGFVLPRWLAATRPGSRSTVLELDRGVVELAARELGAGAVPGMSTRVGDGRTLLSALPDASADVVVGDAFGARAVPWHLATTEFVAQVRRVLRPGGIYVLNVIDRDPQALLRAVTATVGTRFAAVALLARPDELGPGGGGNAVVVAADRPLDEDGLARRAAARGEPGSVLGTAVTRALVAGSPVLTDDRAPVDQLADRGSGAP